MNVAVLDVCVCVCVWAEVDDYTGKNEYPRCLREAKLVPTSFVAATNQARKLQLHLACRTEQAARIKQEVALLALR